MMKKLTVFLFAFVFFFTSQATAQDKVVVIPLLGDDKATECITCTGTLVGTRWCDNGDSTVTDMTTGLVWLKFADWGRGKPWRSDTPGDYDDARTRAGLLHDGVVVHTGPLSTLLRDGSVVGDWRLPTWRELMHLTSGAEAVHFENMRAFSGVQTFPYWPSTTDQVVVGYAWAVLMDNNNGSSGQYTKETVYFVWPVRAGK